MDSDLNSIIKQFVLGIKVIQKNEFSVYFVNDKGLKLTRKIAINDEYGGFGVCDCLLNYMTELGHDYYQYTENREDIYLIKAIEANICRRHDKLKILTIPADVDYEIMEYDGTEWIAEKHRYWGRRY